MPYEILDPAEFLTDGVFMETTFLEALDNYDWSRLDNKIVLVRGCTSAIIPPWAYMCITGKLTQAVKSIRFGNEHDNITLYKNKSQADNTVPR